MSDRYRVMQARDGDRTVNFVEDAIYKTPILGPFDNYNVPGHLAMVLNWAEDAHGESERRQLPTVSQATARR